MRTLARVVALFLLACLLSAVPRAAQAHDPAATQRAAVPAAGAKAKLCANGKPNRVYRDSVKDGPRGVEASGVGVWNKDGDDCY